MLETIATALVLAMGLYLAIGVAVAIFFVWRGAGRIDPSAREGTWGFRLLILPGSVALWPLLLRRFRSNRSPAVEHNAHRDLAASSRPKGDTA